MFVVDMFFLQEPHSHQIIYHYSIPGKCHAQPNPNASYTTCDLNPPETLTPKSPEPNGIPDSMHFAVLIGFSW